MDTTIYSPVIDNDLYAYFVQCGLSEEGSGRGIYGVSVDSESGVLVMMGAEPPEGVPGSGAP